MTVMRVNVWDYGARPGEDCTDAFKRAIDDCTNNPGGGHVIMPYGDSGDYYVQFKSGYPLGPVGGYMGIELKSNVFIHGDESTPITSLPADMGGLPGQLIGVRIDSDTEPGIQNCGLIGVTLRNDLGNTAMNNNYHAIMFHNGRYKTNPAEIRGVLLEGVKILGTVWGDGIYFGSKVSDVVVKRASVEGVQRHGICLASEGIGRSNYLIEDVNMGDVLGGHPFHIESGYNRDELQKALDRGASYEELCAAAGWVQGVTLRRCHFSGTFAFNGVAEWHMEECTSKPRAIDGTGGGFSVTNSPRGNIERCTFHARPTSDSSHGKLPTFIGAASDDMAISDSLLFMERCADGALPSAAIRSRQYGNPYPGWPDRVSVVNSALVTDAGIPMVNAHSGTEWDLSGLRHAELPVL